MLSNQNDFEEKLNLLNNILKQERKLSDEIKRNHDQSRVQIRNLLMMKTKTDETKRKIELEHNKLKLDFNSLELNHKELDEQYTKLKTKLNDEVT